MEIKFDTYRTSKQKLEYYDILEEARMAIEESKKVIEESRKAREKNLQTMYKHRKTIAKVLKDYPEEYEKFLQEISMYKEMIKCNPLPKASNFDLKELNKHLVGK